MSLLTQSIQQTPFLLFENTLQPPAGESAWLFTNPIRRISAFLPDEVKPALKAIDDERQRGHYIAGYLSYEAAFALLDCLNHLATPLDSGLPLVDFYVFPQVERLTQSAVDAAFQALPESPPWIQDWQWHETHPAFCDHIKRITAYETAGDVYQVNHTFRANFTLSGGINQLYQALRQRQRVAYSALLHLPESTILSLSPELFLRKQGNTLVSQPMKGTAKRGEDASSDQVILAAMRCDSKLRSENVMIVDLMRNDIGRIAKTGSVKVSNLFEIQTYQTLHQMISTVQGTVPLDLPMAHLFSHLFPCGSITGAPKIRSMEIIHELENTQRGVYTGALGFITPENDFSFNVPIRTLQFPRNSQQGVLGVGGGIIHESNPEVEWQEALLKARFLTGLNQAFQLIETCRYEAQTNTIQRLTQHMSRLAKSAAYFAFPVAPAQWQQQLQAYLQGLSVSERETDLKIRCLLAADGTFSVQHEALLPEAPLASLPVVRWSTEAIVASSVFRQHKTTYRAVYNRAFQAAAQQGFQEVLFVNQQGYVAEASRHNVFLLRDGVWHTPPLTDGALPGIMRQTLLDDPQFPTQEQRLQPQDLQQGRVFLCNSVRGMFEVKLTHSHPLPPVL